MLSSTSSTGLKTVAYRLLKASLKSYQFKGSREEGDEQAEDLDVLRDALVGVVDAALTPKIARLVEIGPSQVFGVHMLGQVTPEPECQHGRLVLQRRVHEGRGQA